MRSIERQLMAWVAGTLALGAIVTTLTIYATTLAEMNEVFDSDLRNVANSLAVYQRSGAAQGQALAPLLTVRSDDPDDAEIATFTWNREGRLTYSSDARIAVPFSAREGLSRPSIHGEEWIVYTAVHDHGIVQAAQRRSSRHETAREAAAQNLPVLIALMTCVGALVLLGLRRGLKPLDAAARDVAGRSVRSLAGIDTQIVPAELQPMVRAINSLMAKLDLALGAQRMFLADAAHELRTPMAALRLQLNLLERSTNDLERSAATVALGQGVARAQRLIEQLLAIARTDPSDNPEPLRPVDLRRLVQDVIEPHVALADASDIDLGAALGEAVWIDGVANDLAILLNNLIDNALRHTPKGGVVDVGAEMDRGSPTLFVRDTGPGIPEGDREAVFRRFFRGDSHGPGGRRASVGSGLGLAIVKAIADRHGATVRLLDGPEGQGLEVRVLFPQPGAGSANA